jgi:UDP-N-acetylglucosamine 4,6-dehydratase
MDLAAAIAPGCKTEVVGIRPGEKLHEAMIPAEDSRHTIDMGDHFIILPDSAFWDHPLRGKVGTPVVEGFEYNSRDNDQWVSVEEMRSILLSQGFEV